jgi:predicted nucleic acid-binding protein
MIYLLDTGVILRLFDISDPNCKSIRKALWEGRKVGHQFVLSLQNIAEFWNVSTRPATSRGGYGLDCFQAEQRLRVLERICLVLPDNPGLYVIWRSLLMTNRVAGVQVHDARIVAWMISHGIKYLITLNVSDFIRYQRVIALTPSQLHAQHK